MGEGRDLENLKNKCVLLVVYCHLESRQPLLCGNLDLRHQLILETQHRVTLPPGGQGLAPLSSSKSLDLPLLDIF